MSRPVSTTGAQRAAGRGPSRIKKFLPLLIVLVGVGVLLYPVLATQYNNFRQRQFADRYNSQVQQASPDNLAAGLARAEQYNAGLEGVPILDPYLTRISSGEMSDPYRDYLSQLNDFDAMARVKVPSVGIDLPVRHGTGPDALATGAGHLYGTSLPVGGAGTHSVLTSHTGMANATLFDHLADVKEGELVLIDTYGRTLAYRVDSKKIVLPHEIGDLGARPNEDLLTLFTCTPYAVNTHRLLVTGHRVPYDPSVADRGQLRDAFRLEAWMYLLIGAAVVGLTTGVLMIARERRRRRPAPRRAS